MKAKLMIAALIGAALSMPAAAKTTVEFWSNSLSPKFDGVMKDLTAQFNAANPDIEAKWVDVPWDAFQQRVVASIAAGKAPGLVNITVPWMAGFAQQGMLEPLDGLMGDARATYSSGALQDVSYEGKLYGFPWYNQVAMMAYNKQLFAKAGIKTPPKNTEEMLAAATLIKQKTGVAGFIPKLNEEGIMQFFLMEKLPLIENGKAVFNSPAHVALVEQYAKAYKDGAMPKDVFKSNFEGMIASYGVGKVATLITAPSALMRTKTDSPAIYKETAIAAFPVGKAGVPSGNLFMWSMPHGYANKEAAAKLGRFLTSDAAQLAFSKATTTTLPSTTKALKDQYFMAGAKSADPAEHARAVVAQSGLTARTLVVTGLPDEAGMTKRLGQALEEAISGRKPAQKALDEAVAYWNQQLKR